MKITNFGRNVQFEPARVEMPNSVGELRRLVRDAKRVRVMGAKHSWSKGIVTDDTLVSLDRMNRVVAVDRAANRITVEAGIRLKDLNRELEERGLALVNLGSIADQSLGGAIATGTHGTGKAFGCLADQVRSLALVDGNGDVRRLDRDHPDFYAVLVGFGAFGIVFEMTIDVVPSFQLHFVTDTVPFDEVIENLDAFVDGWDHFKFWWLVPEDTVIVFQQNRTDEPRNDSDFQRWLKDEVLAVGVYRAFMFLQRFERKRLVPFVNRVLGREVGKHFDRICKSHVGFLTPPPPVHRETEWAFDYSGARDLLRAYRALLLESGHTYNFVQEIRFTRADEFWLSPGHGRDSIWLSMYNADRDDAWDDQLAMFEEFARDNGGRPHWGKEASFDRDYLATQYPLLDAFGDLATQYDPDGRFRNPYIDRLLSPS